MIFIFNNVENLFSYAVTTDTYISVAARFTQIFPN